MKRILISSTDVMMYLFLLPHVRGLANNNYHVDVACSSAGEYKNEGYDEYIKKNLPDNSEYYNLSTERSPFSLKNVNGYRELSRIIEKGNYDLVWTNEPVVGVMTRLACSKFRKKGLKVLYLAHGYHFFKGAPLNNWIYYPVEKYLATYCDLIVTINWEDYHFTKKHFNAPVKHIDGIGFDIGKFKNISVDCQRKRDELNVASDEILILSAGELMTRKNHEVMIKAVAIVKNPKIKYIICGVGDRLEYLKNLSKKLNVENNVKFIGLRYDIDELLKVSDIFAHPSKREGLGIAPLEAMATGLPIITSNIQGIKDYSVTGETGYALDPNDANGYAIAIQNLVNDPELREKMGKHNIKAVEKYSIDISTSDMESIIKQLV